VTKKNLKKKLSQICDKIKIKNEIVTEFPKKQLKKVQPSRPNENTKKTGVNRRSKSLLKIY